MWGVSEEGLRGSKGVHVSDGGRLVMACMLEASPGAVDERYPPATASDGRVHVVWEGVLTLAEGWSEESLRDANPARVTADIFAKHGTDAFTRIEGEYTFVACDADKGVLYLVRDRCGLKQLYYAVHDGVCYFSSRVRPILNVLPHMRRLCERALYHYVTFGAAPPPLTFFEGINKLAAGDYATVSASGAQHRSYWKAWEQREEVTGTDDEIAGRLLEKLKSAVSRRLDDRKTAVFLSGGMDSSAVTALVASRFDHPIHTFSLGLDKTWGKPPPDFDEMPFARAVADRYDTIHHEFYVGRDDYFTGLEAVVTRLDEPIATSEMGMLDIICRAAQKEGIEVVFNGEGSDTILYGSSLYNTVSTLLQERWGKIRRWPRLFHKLASLLINIHPPGHRDKWVPFGLRWNMYNLSRGRVLYPGKAFLAPDTLQNSLFRPDFLKRRDGEESYSYVDKYVRAINDAAPDAPLVDHMVYRDFPFWLAEYYSVENEKVPAFYGMDVRSPIYDPSIIRFSLGTPLSTKVRSDGQTKYLLRKAMEPLLPRDIIYRPKVGFSTPVVDWLRRKIPSVFLEAYRTSGISRAGIFRDERLEELCRAQQGGRVDLLWLLLTLYLFVRWSDRWLPG